MKNRLTKFAVHTVCSILFTALLVWAQQPVNVVNSPAVTVTSGTLTANQGGAPWSFVGALTNNGAAPAATNFGTLPCLANASAPSWTEGRQVLCSTDLAGNTRVVIPGNVTVTLTSTTITGTVAVTQSTSPWVVSCTVANCSMNLGNWAGTALGTPTAFGTTPGAVVAGSVNASLFSGTTALGTPNTFGVTAPTGNALGVNASLFVGTALASTSAPVPISATTAAQTKTNPLFAAPTDGTNVITSAISALGTAPTGTEVETVQNVAIPFTSGGLTTAISQALTTTINVKATPGQIYGYAYSNPNASVAYVEYYNTATTPGTIGATTNLVYEMMIPAGAAANVSLPIGIQCTAGIAVAVATTATGAVAPGTGLTITTFYK